MHQGLETAKFGSGLAIRMRADPTHQAWLMYYDHGDATSDPAVAATKGFFGSEVKNINRLADIDILIGSPTGAAHVLIEIEERPCSPKKILGDILALLLCNGFAVRVGQEQRVFRTSPETRVIVAGVLPSAGHRLQKVEDVILPRLHQLGGLSDGISPANVHLVFSESVQASLQKTQGLLESWGVLGAA
jgi:hypothetical protein